MKRISKKLFYSLSIPLLIIGLVMVVKSIYVSSYDFSVKNPIPVYDAQSADNQDIPDRQEKEPVYISIFKFIINCNPFKQKKAHL